MSHDFRSVRVEGVGRLVRVRIESLRVPEFESSRVLSLREEENQGVKSKKSKKSSKCSKSSKRIENRRSWKGVPKFESCKSCSRGVSFVLDFLDLEFRVSETVC